MAVLEALTIAKITKALSPGSVLSGEQLQERYAHIWRMGQPLKALAVALPRNTREVSLICKICNEDDQSIVIHGGLTGLVRGTESDHHDLVISLERMNLIEEIDEASRTATVQAGVILESLHQSVEEKELFFPLSFGAKGSAQIGGCISTNAGGMRVLKYGTTRALVLGLEAVMADGTIINGLKKIIKDNTGYALNQLFIGSEGTLGIVTRAVLKLEELPRSRNTAIIGFDNYEKVIAFLKIASARFSGQLSAFELLWGETYEVLTSISSAEYRPLESGYAFYVLIESLGNDADRDQGLMETILEYAIENNLFEDAVVAQTASGIEKFWAIREAVGNINQLSSYQQHFDVSIPVSVMGEYVSGVKERLVAFEGVEHVYPFGHMADGNIHFIVGKRSNEDYLKAKINEVVYGPLIQFGGSVSAEHGIGMDKKEWLRISRSDAELGLMNNIKRTMDPNCILNPGKIFDSY